MSLQESGEMYLETILVLSKTKDEIHQIDVCEEMGFSKPSVSRAMSLLRSGGYIEIDDHAHIHLTDLGRDVAEKIYERHNILSTCFIKLGVSEETAVNDACKIEHVISDETFEKIKEFLSNN